MQNLMDSMLMFFEYDIDLTKYGVKKIPNDDIPKVEKDSTRDLLGTTIFFLNNLPFEKVDADDDDDDHPIEHHPDHQDYIRWLAELYYWPLEKILLSDLCTCGFVKAIYVNFGPKGYYKIRPLAAIVFPPTVEEFKTLLCDLFQGTTRLKNQWTWIKITDHLRTLILSELPIVTGNDHKIIGCLQHGAEAEGSEDYFTYIANATEQQSFVFVVGRIVGEEIQDYIDDFVEVAEYDHADCLEKIIDTMEFKWDINI